MKNSAIILTSGMFNSRNAKTAFGLVRHSEKYRILAVIDKNYAGQDAGKIVTGKKLNIPIYASIKVFLREQCSKLNIVAENFSPGLNAIIGVATSGGVIPNELRQELLDALSHGMHIINGLHHYLSDDSELIKTAEKFQAELIDIRKPKQAKEHAFWTGEIRSVCAPRIAMFGTDCAIGKRTSSIWLRNACLEAGIRTEMIYTGQTGKLQGGKYGFILDSTLNDFVSGELESAIILCEQQEHPDLILLEGQSSLRNPSGPCGSEYLCSALAKGVIIQYAPKQKYFLADDERELWPIPPIEEELELIRLYGSKTLAVTLNSYNLTKTELQSEQKKLETQLGVPVICPIENGMSSLIPIVKEFIAEQKLS